MSATIDKLVAKYPQYAEVPRDKLVVAIGKKYPSYLNNPDDPEFSAEFNRLQPSSSMQPMGFGGDSDLPMQQPPKPPSPTEQTVSVFGDKLAQDTSVKPVGFSQERIQQAEEWESYKTAIAMLQPRRQDELLQAAAPEFGVTISRPPAGVSFAIKPETITKIAPFLEGAPADVVAGTVNAASDLVQGFTTEEGLFTLAALGASAKAGALLHKSVLAVFGTEMAYHAPAQAKAYVQALKDGKTDEAVRSLLGGVAQVWMAKKAFEGAGLAPKVQPNPSVMLADLLNDASKRVAKLPVEDRAVLNNPRLAEVQSVAPLTAQAVFNTGDVTRAVGRFQEQGAQVDVEGGRIIEPAGRRTLTRADKETAVVDAQKEYNVAAALGDDVRMANAMDRIKAARFELEGIGSKVGLDDLPGEWPPTAEQLGTFRSKGPTSFREGTTRAEPELLPEGERAPFQTETPEKIVPAAKPSEQTDWNFRKEEPLTTEVTNAKEVQGKEAVTATPAVESTPSEPIIRDSYGTRTPAVKEIVRNIDDGWSFVDKMTPSEAILELDKIRTRWEQEAGRLQRVRDAKEQPNREDLSRWRNDEGRIGKQILFEDWVDNFELKRVGENLTKTDRTQVAVNKLVALNRRRLKQSKTDDLDPSEPAPPAKPAATGPGAATAGLFTPEALQTKTGQETGIVPSTVMGMNTNSLRRGWQWVKKMFSTTGGKMPEIFKELEAKHGMQSKLAYQIDVLVRGLRDDLRKRYGISRLSMLGGGSRGIPAQAVRMIDRSLAGDPVASRSLPAEIYARVTEMRDLMDKYSSEIIAELTRQAGRLPPGKRQPLLDLIDKIQGNMGVYVHRSYKFFQVKDNAPEWYDQLNPATRTNAENYVMSNSPTPLTIDQAQSLLLRFLDDLKGQKDIGVGSKEGAKDNSIFMKRNVIAPEIKALLGENKNPIVNFALSTAKMGSWIANQQFLTRLKSKGMGRYLFEDGTEPPGFSTKIAGDASDTYSPLNGLRTSPEIAESLKVAKSLVNSLPDMIQPLARLYFMANAQTKFAATGQSWMTQMRNLTSRSPMAIMAGHWNAVKYIPKAIKMTWADIMSKNPSAASKAYVERIRELGLDEGASFAELKASMEDISLQDSLVPDIHQFSILRAIKAVGWDIPGKVYRSSDLMGNIMGWEAEKALLRMKEPTKTEAEIEVMAAENVKQLYPYYGRTIEAVKLTRMVPFSGPFATFAYHIPRTVHNTIKLTIEELRSNDPNYRKVGAIRMSGFLSAITAPYIIQEMSKQTMGISAQEEEDFRKFRPFWDKNAAFMFWGKNAKTGELNVVNLSYFFPTTYITDPMLAIISAVRSSKTPVDAATDVVAEFIRPYSGEQMLFGGILDTLRNKTRMGGSVFEETDSDDVKALKSLKHISGTMMPGTMRRIQSRIIPAFRDEQPDYGRKLVPGPEVFRELSGVAIEKFDFANGLFQMSWGTSTQASDARFHFTRNLYKNTKISENDLLESYMEADARRFKIWQEQRGLYMAAIRRGVYKKEAVKIMKDRGWGNDALDIAKGVYEPINLTDDMLEAAQKNKHTIPKNAIRTYQMESKERKLDPD